MQQITKEGDLTKCFIPKEGDSKVEEYCNANFTDDIMKFQDCMVRDSFCHVCCENEFGELHILERDTCVKNQCEGKKN